MNFKRTSELLGPHSKNRINNAKHLKSIYKLRKFIVISKSGLIFSTTYIL